MSHDNNDRNDLTREHPANHPGQIIGAVLFFIVMTADANFLHVSILPFSNLYIQIPLAVIIAAAAVYMMYTGLKIVFGEKRDPPVVIRKGVFNIVRHPVYSAAMLIMLAFFVMGLSILSFAVIILNFIFYNAMAAYEEKLLLKKFGSEYEQYMNEVGRWLPKPRRK